jgi:hypothetical protein
LPVNKIAQLGASCQDERTDLFDDLVNEKQERNHGMQLQLNANYCRPQRKQWKLQWKTAGVYLGSLLLWVWSVPFRQPHLPLPADEEHKMYLTPKQQKKMLCCYMKMEFLSLLFSMNKKTRKLRLCLVPHEMQNVNGFGMMKCKMLKFSWVCLVLSKMLIFSCI